MLMVVVMSTRREPGMLGFVCFALLMASQILRHLPTLGYVAVSWPRRAWGEVFWIALGEAVGVLGALIGVRVLSGRMHPTVYGELSLALTGAMLASQTIVGPLAGACERHYAMAREDGQVQEFLHVLRRMAVGGSLLVVAAGLPIAIALIELGQTQWLPLELVALAFAVGNGCEGVLDATQNAARRRVFVAWHRSLRQCLRPALAIAVVLLLGVNSAAALLGYSLASLAVLTSQVVLLRHTFRDLPMRALDREAMRKLGRRMLVYAAPISLWGVFTWAQVSSDRWALGVYSSTEQVGLYTVLLQIGSNPVHLLGGVLTQLAAPIIYARAGDTSDHERLSSAIRLNLTLAGLMLLSTGGLALLAMLTHSLIFGIFAGATYRPVSWLLPLAILSAGTFQVGQLATLLLMTLGKTRALVVPKIGTALLAMALNAGAAALFGVPGVLVAGLVFGIVYSVAVLVIFFRTLPRGVVLLVPTR